MHSLFSAIVCVFVVVVVAVLTVHLPAHVANNVLNCRMVHPKNVIYIGVDPQPARQLSLYYSSIAVGGFFVAPEQGNIYIHICGVEMNPSQDVDNAT